MELAAVASSDDGAGDEKYGLPDDVTHYRALYLLGEYGIADDTRLYRNVIILVQDGMVVHSCLGPAFGMVIY